MATKKKEAGVVTITPPNFQVATFDIVGTAPFVQLRFSEKAKAQMKEKMELGSAAKKGKKREPRDFEEDYHNAYYVSQDGKHGIPAGAFRNALVSACKVVGFHMTKGKLALFIIADTFDEKTGTPLVHIKGEPEAVEHIVINATGVADIRVRAMWREWACRLAIRYDADMFTETDVTNLLMRAGLQVGIGEGRADSPKSTGMGWGEFVIATE